MPNLNPCNWSVVWSFCAIATILSFLYGWSVKQEILPFQPVMAFSEREWQFMKIWVNIALVLGIIIPAILWIVFWQESSLQNFFSCYLVAVAIQLVSEIGLSRILCKSVVVIIGTLYTGFRLWQLWSGLDLITNSQSWLSLFWLVCFFWIANMTMLITIAIPSILPQAKPLASKD